MNPAANVVDVGQDFTRFPAGRTYSDGPFCGEAFRDQFLKPALERRQSLTVDLDSALAYGSSFLEEAFGGLIRLGFTKDEVLSMITLKTSDPFLKAEIEGYINSAQP
jgi:hypothetical protein